MNVATLPPLPLIPLLPCDAAIPDLRIGGFEPLAPLSETFAGWREQIASERLIDHAVDFRTFEMRAEDGALVRKCALAYTRHGSGQLVNLLVPAKPANLNNVLRWLRPAQRAVAYNVDVRDRSPRKSEDLVVLRTVALQLPGQEYPIRAIRAAVSVRHSLQYLDDTALAAALEAELGAGVEAQVTRSVDVTHGMATVGEPLPALRRTLHWRNSETGCHSMSFGAGALIRCVDAVVALPAAVEVNSDLEVNIAYAGDGSRVRHTSPGGKSGGEARKASVALSRMRAGIRKALASGDKLADLWELALASFPGAASVDTSQAGYWEVLLDAAEERIGFEGEDRKALFDILCEEKALKQISHGSAAHMAAAFAVLGKRAASADEAVRLREIAGAWISRRWA